MAKSSSEEEIKDKLSFIRLTELRETSIKGNFDLEHLEKINAYIFQDSPEVAGKFRPEVKINSNELWNKKRYYAGFGTIIVCYSPMDSKSIKEAETVLNSIDINYLKTLGKDDFAKEIADIYKKMDYIHPFPDGNSRTLREFTRTLAQEAGFKLDWSKCSQTEIYLARDFEVNFITLSRVSDPIQKIAIKDELDAICYHKEYKPLEKIISDSLIKLELDKTKEYKIEFSFNKEISNTLGKTTYNVLVNGVPVQQAIKNDPNVVNVLNGLANHSDIKAKEITIEQLQNGIIQPKKLEHELKVTRPDNRTLDANGHKIEAQKQKSSSLEL
ncbi:Fic family protein [Gallibacterium anatis]|uniref:Fic family protein n=1 Tax=Gallibacterium anatis TaxID=750 RepID=UPI000BA168B9|nr:Fic family protein [Gallibacterium anatis]OZN48749.1 cell filamentation protein Fic [Gallibacterium anatis]